MRYRPKNVYVEDLGEECPNPPHITVHEEDEWQDTGLLDSHGRPLYRSHRIAMGIQQVPRC